jgi:transposase
MAITLPDARGLSDEVLQALRLRALHACEMGLSECDVADLLGVARETVSRWWSAYQAEGLDGLPDQRTGRPVGSGRTLTEEQASRIRQHIDENTPQGLGIASPWWSRRAVRDLIDKEYGIAMPIRTVGEYLKRWGYTAKRPGRHSKDQDPEEVQEWLEEVYPGIERRAQEEDAEIHFCDETGVAADEHPGLGYAPKGQPATKEVPNSHIRVNLISTISNAGTLHFMTYRDTMDAALFIAFLEGLLQVTTRKVFLIVDRLRAHKAKEVDTWVAEHADRIELFDLPRYAPERNPVEYLNDDLKHQCNADGLPDSKDHLESLVHQFMLRLMQLPEHVIAYFQHPCVQYAAGP